jgi:RNA polymerase sigma-70 factor (ECF subfamily)
MTPIDKLDELYRRHAGTVFRFAYGLCRNRAEAEDIVSETFIRVLTRAERIESATARAYFLTIARNIFLDSVRRNKRAARHHEGGGPLHHDQEAHLGERAALAAALDAIGALPEGERAAFLLRVDHDLSYEEIAAALNISVAAAKVRVHRARVRLASADEVSGVAQ